MKKICKTKIFIKVSDLVFMREWDDNKLSLYWYFHFVADIFIFRFFINSFRHGGQLRTLDGLSDTLT